MAIIVNMVTKNEQLRYLESSLENAKKYVDDIFVYDDQSDDDTTEILRGSGVKWKVRPDVIPSFAEAEGSFRYAGWMSMLSCMMLHENDWVLCLDADEFVVGNIGESIEILNRGGWLGANLKVHEMWEMSPLQKRVDGFWDTVYGLRLVQLKNGNHTFRSPSMACGSVPAYAFEDPYNWELPLELLHFGYAHAEDRVNKYNFYSSLTHNHNPKHIKSIVEEPVLQDWGGVMPDVWRGVRT